MSVPGGRFRSVRMARAVEDERARAFSIFRDALRHPGIAGCLCEHNLCAFEPGEIGVGPAIVLAHRPGQIEFTAVLCDGVREVFHGNDNHENSGELFGCWLAGRINAQRAGREIANQEREEGAAECLADVACFPLQLDAVGPDAAAAHGRLDVGDGGLSGADGESARSRVSAKEFTPDMAGNGLRVGIGLNAHQFEIAAVGKADHIHFGGMVGVFASIFGRDVCCLSEGFPHSFQVCAADGDVINCELGEGGNGKNQGEKKAHSSAYG